MKNLLYIPTFLIFILVFSCGQNSSEKKLNGKWYEIKTDGYKTRLIFQPDRLTIIDLRTQTVYWKADKEQIEFNYKLMFPDSLGNKTKKNVLKYDLSKDNQTLKTTIVNSSDTIEFNLIRADNYIDYLNKKYNVDFSLPKNDSVEFIKKDAIYGLKVFIGYSNNELIGKTELSENLNHLESDIMTFKDSIKPKLRPELDQFDKYYDFRFHLRVFADKKISDSTISKYLHATIKRDISKTSESFPFSPNDTLSIKIYRIYQSEEFENLDYLKGKKIKTIANNVYN